jgi:predicted ArsR family transcriptional regulator
MTEQSRQVTVHRALAEVHRARIVDELARDRDGLDARQLAGRLGLHPNTVRFHLGVLGAAGLVDSRPLARSTPGRPRVVFALREDPSAGPAEGYRLLAQILTRTLAELDDGSDRAVAAGYSWGRRLVAEASQETQVDESGATEALISLLAREGFRPAQQAEAIEMRHCPFGELTATEPSIVCAVHRGLIAGALAELHSVLEVQELDALVEPELCVARLGSPVPATRTAAPGR